MNDKNDSYEIGYRKPPKETRFKKGQSGNPRGRPKRTGKLVDDIQRELESVITITEKGSRRKITKQEALIKRCVNAALNGDQKAINTLLKIMQQFSPPEEAKNPMARMVEAIKRNDRYFAEKAKKIAEERKKWESGD